jgi:hypothetical protein
MQNTLTRKAIYFALLIPFFLTAAEKNTSHKIQWLQPYEKKFSPDVSFRSLNFSGASFDEHYLPNYVITQPLISYASEIKTILTNVVSEPLTQTELIQKPEAIGADYKITTKVVVRKKKHQALISILPIRKNTSGGFEKLVSFDIEVQPVLTAARFAQLPATATTSVLASGEWYRIAVLQTGIYKINYSLLKSMGIDIDNIDPRNIHIYGNGGGMLPFANNKFRHDDLQLNKIIVYGENDGRFDEDDYVLFYGTSQTKWSYNSANGQYNHQVNYYSDSTYYFVTVGTGPSNDRIQVRPSGSGQNTTVTSYDDYIFHEADLYNFLKSGREWYGESMDNLNNTISFNYSLPNLITTDSIKFRSALGGRSTTAGSNSFTLTINNSASYVQNFSNVGTSVQDNYLTNVGLNRDFLIQNSNLTVKYTLNSTDPNAQGWLNNFEFNFRRSLTPANQGSQFLFRDKRSVAAGNISEFIISNASSSLMVWDVTDPLNAIQQETVFNAGAMSFVTQTDQLHEFVAFDGQSFLTPINTGRIENQNLHSLAQADMIIVTNALFTQQAYRLAEFHRTYSNLSVVVATTHQIFNEFSSGSQDVSAIRDFIKMFYDRASQPDELPRYVLLFGDASYDNKYRLAGNTNLVTSYQSPGSINLTQTYISDDFFGLLDSSEGEWTTGEIVDLSVGRLPVKSVGEAEAAVNKIIHYASGNGAAVSNPTLGNWRNILSFVADDQDQNTHFRQMDTLANRTTKAYPLYNIDKIYLDAYNQESTPGGQRYPDAHKAIIDRVERGALLTTYIGHGGELGWAHERVLEVNDINNWTNIDKLSAFLTATCEFTRVDDPSRNSAGELVFLNPNGGGVCLFTTSRLAFSSSNYNLCQKFFTHVFDNSSGEFPTIGEIFERTKVDYYADPYVRNFILIGDPAMKLAYPKYTVKTKTVNGINISQPVDTLKALSKVTITGEVQDPSGNKLTSFNGTIYPTVFDKSVIYSTLGNDQFDADASTPQPFSLQKNVIYGGKASVVNGDFTFTFVVPKDISFQFGKGKISYYAKTDQQDAAGFDTTITVGGVNSNATSDGDGPKIQLYMNDEKFVRGGLTDMNPVLYAVIKDSSGLNTVGTGIGHDMTAELDAKADKKYILNDYYETDLNSYQSGKVRYQFKNLESGPHTVVFKVWDVFNNSSLASTEFIVSESAELALEHVLNYPNPFTTRTTFMFEHNRPYIPMDIQVQVYTVSGKLIKTISDQIIPEGYRSDDLEWDGLDEYGDRIGKGVYIYRLRIKTSDGQYADKFEKLVILR